MSFYNYVGIYYIQLSICANPWNIKYLKNSPDAQISLSVSNYELIKLIYFEHQISLLLLGM